MHFKILKFFDKMKKKKVIDENYSKIINLSHYEI